MLLYFLHSLGDKKCSFCLSRSFENNHKRYFRTRQGSTLESEGKEDVEHEIKKRAQRTEKEEEHDEQQDEAVLLEHDHG